MTKFILILQLFILFLMSSCSNILVYYPEKTTYNHPRDYDINYEVKDSNDNVVHSGTNSEIDNRHYTYQNAGWETITISSLAIGTYSFNSTLVQEGEDSNGGRRVEGR